MPAVLRWRWRRRPPQPGLGRGARQLSRLAVAWRGSRGPASPLPGPVPALVLGKAGTVAAQARAGSGAPRDRLPLLVRGCGSTGPAFSSARGTASSVGLRKSWQADKQAAYRTDSLATDHLAVA